MSINKIIVEMADKEVTFHEFNSIDEFLSSELYKKETEVVIDAEIIPEALVVASGEVFKQE
jgi:hypothetical protein